MQVHTYKAIMIITFHSKHTLNEISRETFFFSPLAFFENALLRNKAFDMQFLMQHEGFKY